MSLATALEALADASHGHTLSGRERSASGAVVLRPAVFAHGEGVDHELTPPLQRWCRRWTDYAGCGADALDHPVD